MHWQVVLNLPILSLPIISQPLYQIDCFTELFSSNVLRNYFSKFANIFFAAYFCTSYMVIGNSYILMQYSVSNTFISIVGSLEMNESENPLFFFTTVLVTRFAVSD